MTFPPASKRFSAKSTNQELALETRINVAEENIKELKQGLDECEDVQSRMAVLDERTKTLVAQSTKNENAVFGVDGNPGVITRLTTLEQKVDNIGTQFKTFMGDAKKLGYGLFIVILGVFIEILVQLILTHGTVLAK